MRKLELAAARPMWSPITLRAAAVAAALLIAPAMLPAQHAGKEHGSMKTIAQVAAEAEQFTTLVAALKAAGLVDALNGAGPFTVFAPRDAAFASLPAGTVEGLLRDKDKLRSVLTFHVIPGKVMAHDVIVAKGARPTTLNGAPLDITVRGGKVYVNGAQVVTADVGASNGVIHVIDGVLMPKAAAAAPARAGAGVGR